MTEQQIQIPPGLLVLTSYGSVTMETTRAWAELRSFNDRQGLLNVGYDIIPGGLVEKARNDAVRRALQMGAQWLGMLDADMTFQPDAWLKILQTAYGHTPWFDVVGGYCSLRGEMALPTIDTGTGTWESHYPNSGILEVIRTGAACLLVKRHVFERIPDPWFRMRVPSRPLDFMAEVDNFARIKFDGRNPFRGQPDSAWEKLEECARQDPSSQGQWVPAEVGEDSAFCDLAKSYGFRIGVDTNVVLGHVDREVRDWTHHKKKLDELEHHRKLCVGFAE